MSSDEDFSIVMEEEGSLLLSEDTLEGVKGLIDNYKKRYEQLLEDQRELAASRDVRQKLTKEFQQRTHKLTQGLLKDEQAYDQHINNERAKLEQMQLAEADLLTQIQRVEAELKEDKATKDRLKQQTDVFSAVPERTVVFTGLTGKPTDNPTFEMEPRVVYPMEGGTALITFEEAVVARKILDMPNHQVDLGGECSISVEAKPVHFRVPEVVEIDSEVCPQRVLVSDLPKMDADTLLDKLELHFCKSKHGGGEVEGRELLPDSGHVVITFKEKHIAKGLTATEYHEVRLQSGKSDKVRVTPFINGKIAQLKTRLSVCPRTVLVTGVTPVMEAETLQDMLEIHFQKDSHGGGEITAILYNPEGQHALALFTSADDQE